MSKRLILRLVLSLAVLAGISCRLFSPSGGPDRPTPGQVPVEPATATPLPTTGTLVVEIVYTGQWYRETFGYEPDAPNIRHIVLAMPVDSQIVLASPGWVFSNLEFTSSPEPLAIREDAPAYNVFLEYLYDAPGGTATIDLVPGEYNVAAAFIAAALPPPDDDAILYPGVTGGGASNDFQVVEIVAGRTIQLSIELTDENGWGYVIEVAGR